MRDNSDRSDSVLDQHGTFRKHVFPVVLSAFVFAVAILCLLEKMHRMRLSVYSTACVQNSYEIAHHLRAYKERHGHYPPPVVYDENGKPKHSWRVLILQNLGTAPTIGSYPIRCLDSSNAQWINRVHPLIQVFLQLPALGRLSRLINRAATKMSKTIRETRLSSQKYRIPEFIGWSRRIWRSKR